MPTLSPQTLAKSKQSTLLAATVAHPRDYFAFSLALGTGLRLAEIVDLDVGDVYSPAGQPMTRIWVRAEFAKCGRDANARLLSTPHDQPS